MVKYVTYHIAIPYNYIAFTVILYFQWSKFELCCYQVEFVIRIIPHDPRELQTEFNTPSNKDCNIVYTVQTILDALDTSCRYAYKPNCGSVTSGQNGFNKCPYIERCFECTFMFPIYIFRFQSYFCVSNLHFLFPI